MEYVSLCTISYKFEVISTSNVFKSERERMVPEAWEIASTDQCF
jgi:hypothetical protein